MSKIDLLDYLSFGSASAKDVSSRFGVALGSVYNVLTSLNIQGLVRKMRGDDGVLTYEITDKGQERLDYLSENEENNEEENKTYEEGGEKLMKVTIEVDEALKDALDEVGEEQDLDDYEDIIDWVLCDALNLTSDEDDSEEFESVKRRR